RARAAVARGRRAHAVPQRGEARAGRRRRDRRDVRIRPDEGPEPVAAQPLDGGRLRAPARAARRPDPLQPPARTRRESLDAAARSLTTDEPALEPQPAAVAAETAPA